MSLQDLLAVVPSGFREEQRLLRCIDFSRLPRHVAIIMDGNGRWAKLRRKQRVEGHRAGIAAVRDVVETSARLGLQVLTLYAFSVENWKRPRVRGQHPDGAPEALSAHGARHPPQERHPLSGHRADPRTFPATCRTSCTGAWSGRGTTPACSSTSPSTTAAAPRSPTPCGAWSPTCSAKGRSRRGDRRERRSSSYLYTAGQPDPDLLIRTSGEMRISNFLLWQIAYAEIWVTDVLWPDFRRRHLLQRHRRLPEARAPLRRASAPLEPACRLRL